MNEFQLAFEKARSEATFINEDGKAKELARSGKFVICLDFTRYCPYTDAIMGTDTRIDGIFDSEAEMLKAWYKLENDGFPADGGFYYTPDMFKEVPPDCWVPVPDDEIPF